MNNKWIFFEFATTLDGKPHEWNFVTTKYGAEALLNHMAEEYGIKPSGGPLEVDLMLDPDLPEKNGTETYVIKAGGYDIQIKPEFVLKMRYLLRYAYKNKQGYVTFPTRDFTCFLSEHMYDTIKKALEEDEKLLALVDIVHRGQKSL